VKFIYTKWDDGRIIHNLKISSKFNEDKLRKWFANEKNKFTKNQVPKRDVEMLMLADEKTGPELTFAIKFIPDNVAKDRIKQLFGELSTNEVNKKLKVEKVAILLESPKWKLLKMGYTGWIKKGGYQVNGLSIIFNNLTQNHDMDQLKKEGKREYLRIFGTLLGVLKSLNSSKDQRMLAYNIHLYLKQNVGMNAYIYNQLIGIYGKGIYSKNKNYPDPTKLDELLKEAENMEKQREKSDEDKNEDRCIDDKLRNYHLSLRYQGDYWNAKKFLRNRFPSLSNIPPDTMCCLLETCGYNQKALLDLIKMVLERNNLSSSSNSSREMSKFFQSLYHRISNMDSLDYQNVIEYQKLINHREKVLKTKGTLFFFHYFNINIC